MDALCTVWLLSHTCPQQVVIIGSRPLRDELSAKTAPHLSLCITSPRCAFQLYPLATPLDLYHCLEVPSAHLSFPIDSSVSREEVVLIFHAFQRHAIQLRRLRPQQIVFQTPVLKCPAVFFGWCCLPLLRLQ